MSLFIFLTVVQALVAALLVAVILMQQSEGGGLGVGGSPSGLMSARSAADFLSRATAILAGLFVVLSIALAVLAVSAGNKKVDTSLDRRAAPAAPVSSAPVDPLALPAAAPATVPAPAGAAPAAQPTKDAPAR